MSRENLEAIKRKLARETCKRKLAAALAAYQQGDLLRMDGLADEIEALGKEYPLHATLLRSALRKNDQAAVVAAVTQVLAKLEQPARPRRAGDGAARLRTPPDREQLKRDCSDALSALQQDQGVPDLDELAASLTGLGPTYAFHGRLMLSALQAEPPHINAIIWNLVQTVDKLEHGVT